MVWEEGIINSILLPFPDFEPLGQDRKAMRNENTNLTTGETETDSWVYPTTELDRLIQAVTGSIRQAGLHGESSGRRGVYRMCVPCWQLVPKKEEGGRGRPMQIQLLFQTSYQKKMNVGRDQGQRFNFLELGGLNTRNSLSCSSGG